jgi:hypothetical protein
MRGPLDHESCSLLVGDMAAGRLDEPRSELVREHLAGCDRCHAELAVAQRLRLHAQAKLGDDERRALRARVMKEVSRSSLRATVTPARRPWTERLLPGLAAAAVVAVLAVAAANLVSGMGSGVSGSADSGGAEGSTDGAIMQAGDRPAIQTRFLGDVGDIRSKGLSQLAARRGQQATAGRETGQGSRPVAGAAPAGVGSQIRLCAKVVGGRRPALEPAFAATGTVAGKQAVIVGFQVDRSRRYSVWAWPRGSCDVPLRVEAGARGP